jgi:hypothetical protein
MQGERLERQKHPLPFLRDAVAKCSFHKNQKLHSDPLFFLPSRGSEAVRSQKKENDRRRALLTVCLVAEPRERSRADTRFGDGSDPS